VRKLLLNAKAGHDADLKSNIHTPFPLFDPTTESDIRAHRCPLSHIGSLLSVKMLIAPSPDLYTCPLKRNSAFVSEWLASNGSTP
jgi:hypothetical protein